LLLFVEFRDEPYIEAIHFSNKSCPLIADPFQASFTTTNDSRSEVSFFVDSDLPECALPSPDKAFTYLNLNEQCARSVVAGETVLGITFEPRCMVVTIAADSRKALFDQLLAAGRPLDDPMRVLVNYTVATENNPDVFAASTNCQNSIVMNDNYQLDRVLQDEFSELAQVRLDIVRYQEEREFADLVRDQTRFFQPPSLPPPPPPSPPPPGPPSQEVAVAPPNPPTLVTYDVYVNQLNTEIARLQIRERVLLQEIEGCESFGGSRTHICGLSVVEGPNPWLAKDGTPCRGHATLSSRFGDFCGYWDSEVTKNHINQPMQAFPGLTLVRLILAAAVQRRRGASRRKVRALDCRPVVFRRRPRRHDIGMRRACPTNATSGCVRNEALAAKRSTLL
jgi:hypothetical protein